MKQRFLIVIILIGMLHIISADEPVIYFGKAELFKVSCIIPKGRPDIDIPNFQFTLAPPEIPGLQNYKADIMIQNLSKNKKFVIVNLLLKDQNDILLTCGKARSTLRPNEDKTVSISLGHKQNFPKNFNYEIIIFQYDIGDIAQPMQNESDSGIWREVKRWEGNSTKNTETFHISGNEWRIAWKCKYSKDRFNSGHLVIEIHKKDGQYVDMVSIPGESEDKTFMRNSGDYYLEIQGLFVDYTIIVEEKI